MENSIDNLIGRIVTGIEVSEGEMHLLLTTDDKPVLLEAEGDCCSESWFAEMLGVQALIGHKVVAVDTLELPDKDDGRTRQESDRWYGYQITTERGGRCTIIFRNSSNGYYGGWLNVVESAPADTKWKKIESDWTAYE